MIIIKEKLKSNIKPIQTINGYFTQALIEKNTGADTYNLLAPEMIYKVDKKNNDDLLIELIMKLLMQIRNFNQDKLLSVNSHRNTRDELIKQLKVHLISLNANSPQFSTELQFLEKNLTNNELLINNEKLDFIINKIEKKLKKK